MMYQSLQRMTIWIPRPLMQNSILLHLTTALNREVLKSQLGLAPTICQTLCPFSELHTKISMTDSSPKPENQEDQTQNDRRRSKEAKYRISMAYIEN